MKDVKTLFRWYYFCIIFTMKCVMLTSPGGYDEFRYTPDTLFLCFAKSVGQSLSISKSAPKRKLSREYISFIMRCLLLS